MQFRYANKIAKTAKFKQGQNSGFLWEFAMQIKIDYPKSVY